MLAWKECELLIEYALENDDRNIAKHGSERRLLNVSAIAVQEDGSAIAVQEDGMESMGDAIEPNTFDENELAEHSTIQLKLSQSEAPILLAAKNSNPNLNVAIVLGKTTSN